MTLQVLRRRLCVAGIAACAFVLDPGCKEDRRSEPAPVEPDVTAAEAPETKAADETVADGPFTVPVINLENWREADQKQFLAAQEHARQNMDDPEAIGALGLLYIAKSVPGPATLKCFTRAAELEPDAMRWHYYLGYTYVRDGMPERALAEYERAIELDPSYAPPHVKVADLIIEEDLDRAESLYQKAAELDPR